MDIENELKHWGILGMKWGVRRYQNEDGSLTPEGRERYLKKTKEDINKENSTGKIYIKAVDAFNNQLSRINDEYKDKNKNSDDWDETYDKEWKKIYSDLLKQEYGEAASKIYDNEKKWLEQFSSYHIFEHDKSPSETKNISKEDAIKNFTKNFKGSMEEYWWGDENVNVDSFKRAVPVEDKDLDANAKEVAKIFGLKKEDLVIDKSDGYIYKKDGSPFIYSAYGSKDEKNKQMDLQYLADEGDWPNNLNFTVFDDKGNPRNDLKEKYIENFVYKNPEFFMIDNKQSENYGKYVSYDGERIYTSIDDLVKDIKKEVLGNNELKHWGILGMKWGIRNYQNPDGSLTALGRLRYGVGPAKDKTGNLMTVNDAGSLSDDELYKMTKRYQKQADYYQARNNFIFQEAQYKRNTTPVAKPKKEHTFLKNVFVKPLENFMAKNMEFGYGYLGYLIMGGEDSDLAAAYLQSTTGARINKKDAEREEIERLKKEKEKQDLKNEIEELKRKGSDDYKSYGDRKREYELEKLEYDIEELKRKRENPDYDDRREQERIFGEKKYYDSVVDRSKQMDYLIEKRDRLAEFLDTKLSDPSVDIDSLVDDTKELEYLYKITGDRTRVMPLKVEKNVKKKDDKDDKDGKKDDKKGK